MSAYFRMENAKLLVQHLRDSGMDPRAEIYSPPGVEGWDSEYESRLRRALCGLVMVKSRLSDRRLHREAAFLGLVQPASRRDARWVERQNEAARKDYFDGVSQGE